MFKVRNRNDPGPVISIAMKSCGDPLVLITIVAMLALLLTTITLSLVIYFRNHIFRSAMSEKALAWLSDKASGWSRVPPTNKIDTHHHCVPSFYAKGTSGCSFGSTIFR